MAELPKYFHFRVLADGTNVELRDVSDHDFVEVVRCKDCKYAGIASMGHLSVCKHPKGMIDPNPNSYCSYSEQREVDDD